MRSSLPVGAEARREIAAILAKGVMTLEKRENQRQIDDSQLAMLQSDDNDITASNREA